MKKLIVVLLYLTCGLVSAQEIRLNTYSGYVFKNQVDSYYSNSRFFDGTIQDGFRWGVGIEYQMPAGNAIEIQYSRQNTNVPTRYLGDFDNEIQFTDFDMNIDWIMVNGTRYFPVSDLLEPFAGAGIGVGIFSITNPDTGGDGNAAKFSWQIRGGTNLWVSNQVGLRFQASLYSAVQGFGGGFYFGTGGSGAGISTYSTMYQFGLEGGLTFRFRQ